MTALFKKLNFKAQSSILVINAPESFVPEMEEMKKVTTVVTKLNEAEKVTFCDTICNKTRRN
jgi:hypothetical protein